MALPTHISEVLSSPRRAGVAGAAGVAGTEPAAALDETFMRRALDLAWTAAGHTRPNPMVGAVVVRGGEVVGEGFHARCGEAHGEVVALTDAGDRARGATLYVTLEPCAHHGQTPPCVGRIISSGVRRVVVTTIDPDRRVDGKGIDTLRRSGVRVDVGCVPDTAVVQNICYYKNRLEIEPTVTLKMAATADGMIASAPGRRDDVTGPTAREYVHRMRATNDCVVVGVGTALVDDPALDCRLIDTDPQRPLSAPLPVVLDTRLRLPESNRWARERRGYVVLTGMDVDEEKAKRMEDGGARVVRCLEVAGLVSVEDAVDALATLGLRRILVEGGAGVFTSFVHSGCWDALFLFQSSRRFGRDGVPLFRGGREEAIDGRLVDSADVGGDVLHRLLSARAHREIVARVAERYM
jgi:diaminohydroxyphosphoribosylaminopyrimidine deaminase/5-amino-6-(5-phosphoribosylamino)uracil reductase